MLLRVAQHREHKEMPELRKNPANTTCTLIVGGRITASDHAVFTLLSV
jgi:hypothetical protein